MTSRTLVIRRGSLVALLIWVAVLAVDLARRQLGVHPPEHRPDIVPNKSDAQDPVVRHHTGFVYSDTLGGVPSFRMAAREADEHA
ncbi:MAG TPA: hypothetical protein VLW17_08440, partial [Thermoanaerobaculaceae bacterium]|nr:hypothetical protein [Thermoanaerobaculaceae bacterium]